MRWRWQITVCTDCMHGPIRHTCFLNRKGTSVLGSIVNALDFNEVRSQSDAELLYDAKYGKRGEDGRMTREQYSALRRRVVGTSRDFFKVRLCC